MVTERLAERGARGVAAVLGTATLAALAACVAPEVSDGFVLELQPGTAQVAGTWRLPSVTRAAVDFAVTNDGSGAASFVLRSQAQTSGDPLLDACEALEAPELRVVAAAGAADPSATEPDEGLSAPGIGSVGDAVLVDTDVDGSAAFVLFRSPADSQYQFAVDATTTLDFYPLDGAVALVPARAAFEPTTCDGIETLYVIALQEGDYLLRFVAGDGRRRLHVSELCVEARTVGRTCPGEASAVSERVSGALRPNERWIGRVDSDTLGVGDQVALELRCADDSAACAATLEAVFVTEALECRSDDQCSGAGACTDAGYCARGSGCAAAQGRAGGGVVVALVAWLVLRRRRAGSRPSSRRDAVGGAARVVGAVIAVCAIAAAPAHAQQTRQVYTGVGATSSAFVGELGRLTSPGFGLHLTQGLQLGLLGGQLTVGTDYYLTRQDGPPLTRSLQTFTVAAGPRVAVPLPLVRVFGDVEYAAVGLLTNSLTATTGARGTAHGVGGAVTARLEAMLPVYIEVRFGVRSLFGLDAPATYWGLSVSLGVAGTI